MSSDDSVTFRFEGDTYAILVNALSDAARLLEAQAGEQERWGRPDHAANLLDTARQTHELLAQVHRAAGVAPEDGGPGRA